MAIKRMISKIVAHDSKFLRMKTQSKLLYIFSCLEADDKGAFNSIEIALHNANARTEHLNELVENGFLIKLKEDVYVITHWYTQNQIDKRTEQESFYIQDLQNTLYVDERGVFHRKEDCKNAQGFFEVPRTPPRNAQNNSEASCADSKNAQNNSRKSKKNKKVAAVSIVENSIVENSIDKSSIDQNTNTHTSLGDTNTDACVCADSCDLPDDLPATLTDPPSDLPGDFQDDLVATDPPDITLPPKELTAKAEEVRKRLKTAGLKVPDQISWLQRDFRFALEGKRRLKLSDEDFFGALENYATLIEARKTNPAAFWWESTQTIGSLFNDNGKEPSINRFLPYAFNLEDFKKGDGARASPKRGIDQLANYDAKAIAAKQAEDATVYENEDYTGIGF